MFKKIINNKSIYLTIVRLSILCVCIAFCEACGSSGKGNEATKKDLPDQKTPIDEMIAAAKKSETPFLAEVLQQLKNNEQVDINGGDLYKIRVSDTYSAPASKATALQRAVELGDLAIVKFLLEKGADPNKADDSKDNPLHQAVVKGNVEIVKVLLAHKSINVNQPTDYNQTPLFLAAEKQNLEIVKMLLAYRPRIQINTKDNDGNTPLARLRSEQPKQDFRAIETLLVKEGATE